MTLGELREAYKTILKALQLIVSVSDEGILGIEADIDLSVEWAILVRDTAIYLEYNKNDELFKQLIEDNDIRDAMHKVIDMSNNEDQGD